MGKLVIELLCTVMWQCPQNSLLTFDYVLEVGNAGAIGLAVHGGGGIALVCARNATGCLNVQVD